VADHASDGHTANREIALLKLMFKKSPLFKDYNFQDEINSLVNNININGKKFISTYFNLLG
jgi:hypothetical protein